MFELESVISCKLRRVAQAARTKGRRGVVPGRPFFVVAGSGKAAAGRWTGPGRLRAPCPAIRAFGESGAS